MDGSERIDSLPDGLAAACEKLIAEVARWPGVTRSVSDRYVGLIINGTSVCQLHAKPARGYVWVHVPKASYRSQLHFEDRGYLGNYTRFRFERASDLDEAARICRVAYDAVSPR